MSKVICDICGTTFPETANQCPICGCARKGAASTAADNGGAQAEAGSTYSYVSGGRFSKANVRKSNKTGEPMQRRASDPAKNDGGKGSNTGLVIVVIVLLLAIIAVCAYIGIRFFLPDSKPNDPTQQTTTQPSQSQTQPSTGEEQDPTGIACTDIQLSSTIIEFMDMERSQLLSAVLSPVDTTDELIFTSSDTDVATVTDGGLVIPVGPGETTITVTCGQIQKECRVVCNFSDETEPTEPEPEPGNFELAFNTKFVTKEGVGDVTLKIGDVWRMYATMNVEASKVVWTSDNDAVATIKDGVVTAVGPTSGHYILVHAEYAGVKYSCRIRITGRATVTPEETTPPATDPAPEQPSGVVLTMNRTDFTLRLSGARTHNVYKNTEISGSVPAENITWTSENPDVCIIENGLVTAVGVGVTQIYAEYDGQRVSCIVRVQE